MKQFIRILAAVIVGIFLGGLLLFIGVVAVISTLAGSIAAPTVYTPKENTLLRIDLNGEEREYIEPNPWTFLLGEDRQELSLQKQLQAIRLAQAEPTIQGIYLNAKNWSTGIASAQTLRKALSDFKESGKFIVAYADQYTQSTYYLCSIADKIIINPAGTIDLHGLSSTRSFYLGLLQKLGVNLQIFKVGAYKSAVEPFTRKDMSAESKEQTRLYLTEQWNQIVTDISESRAIDPQRLDQAVNDIVAFDDAFSYVQSGLADTLLYRSETESYLKELTSIPTKENLKIATVDEICTLAQNDNHNTSDKIAILYAEGEITDLSKDNVPYNGAYITSDLLKEIQALKNDEQIKAVILRVNSPGGSAFLSEQIWKELNDLKAVKPLIVSMGDVAASGGYYIASCANRIIAEPTTITGSIGIFGIIPDFSGLIGKTGITFDEVTTNAHARFPSLIEPMDDAEKQALQIYIERGYQLFLQRCAEGRGVPIDTIAHVAEGRVWSGISAQKAGLIDELGNLEKAIAAAADYAGINEYEITAYPKQKDLLTLLSESPLKQLKHVWLPLGKEEMHTLRILHQLKNIETQQARLPFEINTTF